MLTPENKEAIVPRPCHSRNVVMSCAVLCLFAVPSGILVSSASELDDAAVSKAVKMLTEGKSPVATKK
jgi:hypothetical protein